MYGIQRQHAIVPRRRGRILFRRGSPIQIPTYLAETSLAIVDFSEPGIEFRRPEIVLATVKNSRIRPYESRFT